MDTSRTSVNYSSIVNTKEFTSRYHKVLGKSCWFLKKQYSCIKQPRLSADGRQANLFPRDPLVTGHRRRLGCLLVSHRRPSLSHLPSFPLLFPYIFVHHVGQREQHCHLHTADCASRRNHHHPTPSDSDLILQDRSEPTNHICMEYDIRNCNPYAPHSVGSVR